MVQMLAVIAEFERATIIERVIAGMEKKAAKGGWNGGAPYGYDYDDTTGALVPNKAEAPIVGRIFDFYVNQLWGSTQIARWLNDAGLRTKRSALWSPNAVRGMLGNRAYIGEVSFRGTSYPGRHAPIIKRLVFDRTQEILTERGEDMATRRSHRSLYLLSGRLRCTRCGRSIVGVTANGNGGAYRYYTCSSRIKYGQQGCDQERLPAADLERAVIKHLIVHLTDEYFLSRAAEQIHHEWDQQQPNRQEEQSAVEQELHKVRTTIDRYLRAFETGSIPEEVCGERLRELREQAARLEDQRSRLADEAVEPQRPPMVEMNQLAARLAKALSDDEPPRVKQAIRQVVDRIDIGSRDYVRPTIRLPLVRIQGDQVGPPGLEPGTDGLPEAPGRGVVDSASWRRRVDGPTSIPRPLGRTGPWRNARGALKLHARRRSSCSMALPTVNAAFSTSIRFLPRPERSFVVSPPAAMAELPTAAEVARAVADGLEERGLPYAIGGAIALGFYAPPRATVDVDVNVFISPESGLDDLLAALAEMGVHTADDPVIVRRRAMEDGQFRGSMRGLRVDVFVPVVPYYGTLQEHRRQVPLLGRPLWIVGPEDLAVLKLMFFRRKDLADVEAMLRDQGKALDRDYIRRTLAGLVGETDERVRELRAIERDVDTPD